MPILDDQDNPASSNTKLTLAEVLNSFAFLLKNITGKDSWKIPPGVSLADLAQNQGLPGETGPQGIQGEKGEKGDPGEPAPLDHQHAIADVSGLQTALDSKSFKEIITSASAPNNPTQGLIWNELDSSNNLIETWAYSGTSWVSALKNLSVGVHILSGGTQNVRTNFCFNQNYNIFIKKWTVNLISLVALSNTNYLACYLLKNLTTSLNQLTINPLAANTPYSNTVDINQLFTFASPNFNLFEFRVFVAASPVSFFAASNISYNLIRK
ncbi:collagen-like protein [Scytonema hofmannii FACHB-248]|uniref:Collagen-like protein n=1 Tax=Scytonema hofmannii FACHB-248 TaxID=1842502 RepID=A0ABR8H2I9_9CYAN|nr:MULTISPECIES: collagen-like protein [Nostocales]MBD2609455.1 collagen-like protein [Scytonema hofmannii FACHB-248]